MNRVPHVTLFSWHVSTISISAVRDGRKGFCFHGPRQKELLVLLDLRINHHFVAVDDGIDGWYRKHGITTCFPRVSPAPLSSLASFHQHRGLSSKSHGFISPSFPEILNLQLQGCSRKRRFKLKPSDWKKAPQQCWTYKRIGSVCIASSSLILFMQPQPHDPSFINLNQLTDLGRKKRCT